jgi:hypothetical protein
LSKFGLKKNQEGDHESTHFILYHPTQTRKKKRDKSLEVYTTSQPASAAGENTPNTITQSNHLS